MVNSRLKILELKFGYCYCCLYKSKHYFNMLVTVIANHISAWLRSAIQLASHVFKFLCALIMQHTAFTLHITSADICPSFLLSSHPLCLWHGQQSKRLIRPTLQSLQYTIRTEPPLSSSGGGKRGERMKENKKNDKTSTDLYGSRVYTTYGRAYKKASANNTIHTLIFILS